MKRLLIIASLYCVLGSAPAWATTYYVGTTGNDANAGTIGSRFLTINKCHSVAVAGDTCIVGSGTYTDTDGDGRTFVTTNGHNGTSGNPITIQSETQYGAIITVPGLSGSQNDGMLINANYLIIDGFEITGGSSGTATGSAHTGINIFGGTGIILRNNKIHDISRTLCYNDTFGNSGIYVSSGTTSIEISNNVMYAVGRLRNGESGCSTTIYQHDHGMYINGAIGATIKYNTIYDTNRGYPIQIYGGTTSNLVIAHNTFDGHSPTGLPVGQIVLGSTINTGDVVNNISYDAGGYFVDPTFVTASSVTVRYNISDGAEKVTTASGVTFSNNLQNNANINFTNAATHDYTLANNSAAIDAGTVLGGNYTYNGAAPDMGAFEGSGGGSGGGQSQSPALSSPRRFHLWRR